ncbi:MAG: metalloendopeptidase [Bacteroidales bacterium]|nr:MAG: metalloendopeptidase [Bacteroidales bacterium]
MKQIYKIIILLTLLIVIATVVYWSVFKPTITLTKNLAIDKNTTIKAVYEYGIPIDSFTVVKGRIRTNQTLGELLSSLNVKPNIINKLPIYTKGKFDLRQVVAGNTYKAFLNQDSASSLVYLIYEKSPIDFVVFNFKDSLTIENNQKEVTLVRKLNEATISSSLWETIYNLNLNPNLALDMSDIFAWTVDFFGLQKGDRFKVLYDERYVGNTSVGIGMIYAAWFEHKGERFYAYRFAQDSTASYWDEKGNSLRKSFLKAPLHFSRITSRYSGSRFHPVLKIYRPHTGVDYAAPTGTPIMAIGDGFIIEKGYNGSAGNYLKIRHNSVYTTGYNHLSRFGNGVANGVRVKQGQIIGFVGSTGSSTGPHLDMRFWMNGHPVDPLKVKSPPVEPIKNEMMQTYLSFTKILGEKLDSIPLTPIFPEAAVESIR